MKKLKLNKKCFNFGTIVVAFIIAIVIITFLVLNLIRNSKINDLQKTTDKVSEWFSEQYELASSNDSTDKVNRSFSDFINEKFGGYENITTDSETTVSPIIVPGSYEGLNSTSSVTANTLNFDVIKASGISDIQKNIVLETDPNENRSYVYYNIVSNKMCVVLYAKENGDFYVKGNNKACSSGCFDDCD